MTTVLNVVSFDIPYPPDYGGVTDVYWKLFWLHKAGVRVILHCFHSRRNPAPELNGICEQVHYYRRAMGFRSNLSTLPFTVKSRESEALVRNLLANDHPILFEVLHTCGPIADPRLRKRLKIYRHSNIEHEYYKHLSKSERKPVKRLFLRIEAEKLRRFEKILRFADIICAVNADDTQYFSQKYPQSRSVYLPSFHPNEQIDIPSGKGDYVLFHGNLSISENYEAARWLAANVFPGLSSKVIVAGLDPPPLVKKMIAGLSNVELVASPSLDRMRALIRDAQVHVLYTRQATGLKLKLLNVLFGGRFVVCNTGMLAGTGISPAAGVVTAESPDQFVGRINGWIGIPFSAGHAEARRAMVSNFMNQKNVQTLVELIS
jgi:hypothetical protein